MIKAIGIASMIIAGSAIGYNHLKYIDAPEAPVIQNVETNLSNPKVPVNKIDFTSKIMDKNLLYVTGFEDRDIDMDFRFSNSLIGTNREFGGQSKVDERSSEGRYSAKIQDTISNGNQDMGNDLNGNHQGYSHYSIMRAKNDRLYIPSNSHVGVTMDVFSTDKKTSFTLTGAGGLQDKPIGFHSIYSLNNPITFIEDVHPGDTELFVSDLSEIAPLVQSGKLLVVALNYNTNGDYSTTTIESVDVNSNKIKISAPMKSNFFKGDLMLSGVWRNPLNTGIITVKSINNWETLSIDSNIDGLWFDTDNRGIILEIKTKTEGITFLDNIKFGYTNQVKINRDGIELYNGYDTSLEDKTAKDLEKPNKVESIQSNIILKDSSTNQIKVNITAPQDNGTEYTYTATASFDGKESRVSEPVKSVVTTGVDGYSYVIDTNSTTEPDNTIDTRETSISKDVPNDGSVYYLHIKAIDKAGNVGETTHKKMELYETIASLIEGDEEIRLNWTFSDSDLSNYYFKIFRKENEGEFIELVANTVDRNYLDTNTLDKEKPSTPILKSTNYNKSENTFEFIFDDSIDRGTKYSYYVEAYLNDNSKVSTSNIVIAEISSGLNGYSYVINNKENFVPDDIVNNFVDNKISVPVSNAGNYIHIKAIDTQGNESEVLSIKAYDDVNPALDLRLTDYRPNNTGLSIVATGQDNIAVKYIRLPNGSVVEDRTVNFKVTKNGEYEFTVYDVAGNSFTESINITNIDKTPPTIEFEEFKEGDEYKIKVMAKDGGSGISHIILPNGDKVNADNYTITAEPNVSYEFKVYDLAGNFSVRSTQVGMLEPKNATANLDIYIKSENMLSLSLNSNSISFNDFNGTEDLQQDGALELSINSSLPYEINAYMEYEIQNADKSETMDKSILNLKESSDSDYKEFSDIKTKLNLVPHVDAGNDKIHNFDFKLNGGIAHKKDVYKATIKFEVKQK